MAILRPAAAFFLAVLPATAPRMAVKAPVILACERRLVHMPAPSHTIQPWQVGHPEAKATCLGLRSPPPLALTALIESLDARVLREPPGLSRLRNWSRKYPAVAAAMVEQWSVA